MEPSFWGEWVHKVDAKGRVSIPAPFRRVLEAGDPDWVEGLNPSVAILYGRSDRACLECFTIAAMGEINAQIARAPRFSDRRRKLLRLINTRSVYAQVDENGRMVLRQDLRERIGLQGEATFAGMDDMFEIWEPGAFAADDAKLESEMEQDDLEDLFSVFDQARSGAVP